MKRRAFLGSVAAASVPVETEAQSAGEPAKPHPGETRLAGLSLPELRRRFHDELFQVLLPFWDKHGIDHENGGVMCSLDYDGTLINSSKLLWFQGRAIWVYSYLYNHLGRDPRHLEIARKTKDFLLRHARQPDGWWAEQLTREGQVMKPFGGDIEGLYFIAEGLQEYAAATGDDESRQMAFDLLKKLFNYFNRPDFRYMGPDFPYLSPDGPCVRPQGTWMLNLGIASQMLQRWNDPQIATVADTAMDAIVNRHYNPDIGLNTEMLYFDFTRPKDEERKVRLGHGVEVMWMVMDEANRRKDPKLWATCAARIQRQIDVGWDRVYGGLSQWVNVDQGAYKWPPETPVGTDLSFQFVGEYNYMKALWGLNEVLVATLYVFERTRADWAANYFAMAYQVLTDKFSMKKHNLPGYVLFADRQMTYQPHVARQDNYHPLRQLMLNIVALDRMIKGSGGRAAHPA